MVLIIISYNNTLTIDNDRLYVCSLNLKKNISIAKLPKLQLHPNAIHSKLSKL